MTILRNIALASALCFSGLAHAQGLPHVGNNAQATYTGRHANSGTHKAFAIAPVGGWQWVCGKRSRDAAIADVLSGCGKHSFGCTLYDVDDEVVFSPKDWAAALPPLPPQAPSDRIGGQPGETLPDIVFTSEDGSTGAVSNHRGKLVLVHIWASWCPPCASEMPAMEVLYNRYRNSSDIVFFPISTREAFSHSLSWARGRDFTLPYVHSGHTGKKDYDLDISGGDEYDYKDMMKLIPSTFLIDRNGVVIWRKIGSFDHWPDFADQVDHAIAHSVK